MDGKVIWVTFLAMLVVAAALSAIFYYRSRTRIQPPPAVAPNRPATPQFSLKEAVLALKT